MLILPPWYFAYCTDNQPSTPSNSAPGTQVTPGTSNADGSAVTLLSALSHDVHRLVVAWSGFNLSTAAHYTLLDILQDPAGGTSWASLIDDILAGFSPASANTTNSGFLLDFPIWIPAGTSIGAQARTSHTSATAGQVSVWAYGEPSRPEMWWCGQGVETLGVTASTSRGTSVTPGTTATWGTWTSVGGTTGRRYGAIEFSTGGTDSNSAAASYQFQVGISSNVLRGYPIQSRWMGSAESGAAFGPGGVNWCDIPAGTQMQVRGRSSTASPETWDVALYGVY